MAEIEADVDHRRLGHGRRVARRTGWPRRGSRSPSWRRAHAVDRAEATQRFWDALIKVPECPYPPGPEADHPIGNDPDYWYRQDGPDKFNSTYIKVVGGTTWHWLGTCLRLLPNDFQPGTRLWPRRRLADRL